MLDSPQQDIGEVDLSLLKRGISPRIGELDADHAQALAARFDECPPILVEKNTSTIIDGAHRVMAAKMLDRHTITVRYFEGTHEDAFVESVKANVTHGKPLTLLEREVAAKKLLDMHSDWSNRLVGDVCGLSDKTVGRLRSTTENPELSARVGRDGRHRPVDARQLRAQIATALRAEPDASPEKLAQLSSTSPSTIRDVRNRLRKGDDPIRPERGLTTDAPSRALPRKSDGVRRATTTAVNWRADRAILSLPRGSELAEWLEQTKIHPDDWEALVAEIPLGRIPQLIAEAESRATEWTNFASSLEKRSRELQRKA